MRTRRGWSVMPISGEGETAGYRERRNRRRVQEGRRRRIVVRVRWTHAAPPRTRSTRAARREHRGSWSRGRARTSQCRGWPPPATTAARTQCRWTGTWGWCGGPRRCTGPGSAATTSTSAFACTSSRNRRTASSSSSSNSRTQRQHPTLQASIHTLARYRSAGLIVQSIWGDMPNFLGGPKWRSKATFS